MRIAILSSTEFGKHCLENAILQVPEVELCGILTTPRKIDISYSDKPIDIKTHFDFTLLESSLSCEIIVLSGNINAESYLEPMKRWNADLILALGWYYMIPKRVREAAAYGCLGIHASLLPKYRGGAPIPWAIINGEKETGVTLFHMADGVDDGDIVAQKSYAIKRKDTCNTIYKKATLASSEMLLEMLPLIREGKNPRQKQHEKDATYYPQRKPDDGRINWNWPPEQIRNFIRGQTKPYPGAYTIIGNKKVVIWNADIENTD